MIARFIGFAVLLGLQASPAMVRSDSQLLGKWESQASGYASFTFDRKGGYLEVQEGLGARTGRRIFWAEAKGQYSLRIRELELRQSERTVTTYRTDGAVDRVRKYGRSERVVEAAFPRKDQLSVTDSDGSRRLFVRVRIE